MCQDVKTLNFYNFIYEAAEFLFCFPRLFEQLRLRCSNIDHTTVNWFQVLKCLTRKKSESKVMSLDNWKTAKKNNNPIWIVATLEMLLETL